MAVASSFPAILRMSRSAQSGEYVLTADYQTVYHDSSNVPYIFGGATINLSTMSSGDSIDIVIRKRLTSGGDLIGHDHLEFNGARPTNNRIVNIGAIPDIHGVDIIVRQSAGTFRTVDFEFMVVKRIGAS